MRLTSLFTFTLALFLVALAGVDAGPSAPELGIPVYGAKVGGQIAPDGTTELALDFPGRLHRHNVASPPGTNNGCCVFTSIHHAALWQDVPELQEFPKWIQSKRLSGGGYPGNVDQRIAAICAERKVAKPEYLQFEGWDYALVKAAIGSGRMVSGTYSHSPTGRYGGQKIAHMVNYVHADDQWVAVLDNNYMPSAGKLDHPDNYEWMTPAEMQTTNAPGGRGWIVVLLKQGPPLPPCN